jgi:Ricin-type beta-trefoil lectin domain-like/Secretion system C-terminal sorting domain
LINKLINIKQLTKNIIMKKTNHLVYMCIMTLLCIVNTIAKPIAKAAVAEQTNYEYKIAYCVGTKNATAWIGNNVVVVIEGETPSARNQQVMDKMLILFDRMEAKYIEITGLNNLALNSGYKGKPVIEIVNDNCGAGGLAAHGILGMSTGKGLFNEMYEAVKNGQQAIHQVFFYETARNFYLTANNDKIDWTMDNQQDNWGWWTVGFNNANAVILSKILNVELLYYGQGISGFRNSMIKQYNAYVNGSQYNFQNGWSNKFMPWDNTSSVNDLMSGMIIYGYENFGGEAFIKNVYANLKNNEISNRSGVFAYQECRDNVYKIWSLSAKRDLKTYFEATLKWSITSNAKSWVAGKLGINNNPLPFNSGDVFTLTAKHSDKYMSVNGSSQANGGNIDQWTKRVPSGANQQFKFVHIADGFYQLQAINSGKCADVANASLSNGANIQQWDCSGGANQLWKFVKQTDGTYMVISKSSGKALDVSPSALSSNNLGNGANVQQWDAYGGNNQKWWINPVSGASSSVLKSLANTMESKIQVYPNPFEKEFNFSTSNKVLLSDVSLYDVQGKKQTMDIENIGNNTYKVNTDKLASGIYFLKVNSETDFKTIKIVKQ